MKKYFLAIFVIMLIVSLLISGSGSYCEPTKTPRPTATKVEPTKTATHKPKKKKTPTPYSIATVEKCPSDCEFKAEVLDLLKQILEEVRK